MTMYVRLYTGLAVLFIGLGYCLLTAIDRAAACSIAAAVMGVCATALTINALRGKGDHQHDR